MLGLLVAAILTSALSVAGGIGMSRPDSTKYHCSRGHEGRQVELSVKSWLMTPAIGARGIHPSRSRRIGEAKKPGPPVPDTDRKDTLWIEVANVTHLLNQRLRVSQRNHDRIPVTEHSMPVDAWELTKEKN